MLSPSLTGLNHKNLSSKLLDKLLASFPAKNLACEQGDGNKFHFYSLPLPSSQATKNQFRMVVNAQENT